MWTTVVLASIIAAAATAKPRALNMEHFTTFHQSHRRVEEASSSSSSGGSVAPPSRGSSSSGGSHPGEVPTYNGTGNGWTWFCEGNCLNDVTPSTTAGTILMGGGLDVGAAFKQQIKWSGGGDFVIIRSDVDNGYDDWIYSTLGGVNSVTSLIIYSRAAADSDFVIDTFGRAEAVFIAGGDQWQYFQDWNQTRLAMAIYQAKGVLSIGGTSAGCMVQPGLVFNAKYGGVTSGEALRDPTWYGIHDAISPGFILSFPALNRTLIDTHFVVRDRFGRLLTFMADLANNAVYNVSETHPLWGIGIDQHTAFAVGPDNSKSTILGNGTAYVLKVIQGPTSFSRTTGLSMPKVQVQKLVAGDSFDFSTMTGGSASNMYSVGAQDGQLTTSDPYSPGN